MNIFDDLNLLRKGGEGLCNGAGASSLEPLGSKLEWQKKAEALRQLYKMTLGIQPEGLKVDFDAEILSEEDCGDYLKRKIEFNVARDERIKAYMQIPKGIKGKKPAMLCLPPTTPFGIEQTIGNDPSERGQDRAYALHLVKRGFITFSIDWLSAASRRYADSADFDTANFYKVFPEWSIRGKDLYDVSRTIDFLETLEEIDSSRIGSIGHSQGGGITIHAMAMDERIKAGVSSCGEWPQRISKNPFNNARQISWVGRPLLRPFCLTGKDFPVDMHELLAMIAPRAVMNISALNDCMHSVEEAESTKLKFDNMAENVAQIFGLFNAGEKFRSVTHLNGHSFIEEQRETAYGFLDKFLGSN